MDCSYARPCLHRRGACDSQCVGRDGDRREGLPVNLLAYPPDSSRPPQDAPEQFQVGRSAVIHPGFGRKQSSSGLTATQAGTSGTTWTISRTLTPRPDVSGCPGTICADLRIRRLGVRIPPGAPVFHLVKNLFFAFSQHLRLVLVGSGSHCGSHWTAAAPRTYERQLRVSVLRRGARTRLS